MTRAASRSTGKALTVGAFGAKGVGKSSWLLAEINAARPPRLITWDYKGDPNLKKLGREFFDMPAFIRAMRGERFSLRYRPTHDKTLDAQFALFCRAAWIHGRLAMFVPELPEVTASNRAPDAWRTCVNVGREYTDRDGAAKAISIFAEGQRIAECDKSFINNLDVMHCGRLGNVADAKAAASKLGCDWRELLNMPDFAWIERRAGQLEPTRGTLRRK
jgi:hypothetical protein